MEEKVFEHIRSGAGTHFDPEVVETFIKIARESDNCELNIQNCQHKRTFPVHSNAE
jgi:response regulator RpfG family c-di-GMP phosphodiesterase